MELKTEGSEVAEKINMRHGSESQSPVRRTLALMPCSQHKLAISKAAGPQPVFRSDRARLAQAWEEGVAGVPACYVFRDAGHGGTKSGMDAGIGPAHYDNYNHKDRFGALLKIEDRSRTLWDMHIF